MTLDAACASSFVALDVGCHALMAGDTRVAVVGGVDLGTNPAIYVGFSRVDGLSISGHSNPFDYTADGLIIGEGVGMAVLKRLEDAIQDGDRIRAVIKSCGSSSDGAGQAIYAPSVKGRAKALKRALAKAELDPAMVQYLEAHATSTVVGDANEYDAISTVYSPERDPKDPLIIGSVKQQIGHLKAAAGAAGLIKTVLCMENGTFPHMPRFTKLTPDAELSSDAIRIPTTLEPWEERSDGKRYAAVTSSGFGGVNYHVVLEQGDTYKGPKSRPTLSREVAVIGMSCRVAGADTIDGFWQNVEKGVDVFSDVVAEDVGWEDHLDTGPLSERITTRVVSRLDDYKVDLLRHKIFPKSVSQISPTQFLGLDLADRLLEEAGFDLAEPKEIGVSIGAMHDDYFPAIFGPMLIDEYAEAIRACPSCKTIDPTVLEKSVLSAGEGIRGSYPPVTEHTLPGWMTNVVAGRIANKLNLQGPNFTIDSACSSGIGALMPAIYQLMFGDVDMMISGGLNQQLSDAFTCGVCALGAVTERVTRPFDAEGDGYLIGEGGVFFLLKRLEDARRDKDDIIAVIHGVDGSSESDSKSMIAPSEKAFRRAIHRALAKTDIDPEKIGIVDTHGSANQLSDLVEARSLAAELRKEKSDNPVQITAIKSHVGHLYGGAAAASLFSTIQSLKTQTVPGIRNLKNPRPEIEELAGLVQPRYGTEPLSELCEVGGVSTLGLGGANFFAVVTVPENQREKAKEAIGTPTKQSGSGKSPAVMRVDDEVSSDIFVCIAEKEQGLGPAVGRALKQESIPQFISEGSSAGVRLAATFLGQDELKTKLSNVLRMLEGGHGLGPLSSQGVFVGEVAPGDAPQKLAFCFPGQGTHYISMGRHLYETNPLFKGVLDDVNGLAKKTFDFDLLGHIHGDENDGKIKSKLGTLLGAQTALFSVELGMATVLKAMGIQPDVMIGHSFGEISALTVAGVWDLDVAFKVVEARIKAAEQIIKGGGPALGMMSVICSEEQRDAILGLFKGEVVLTNINAPGRYIFAGQLESVKKTVTVAESFGADARVLPIGAAFHSHFMEPAREPFKQALMKLPCSPPSVPILSTISGEYIDPADVRSETLADHLSKQLITQLNLPREVSRLYDDGVRHFLEVGPGWSMTKMVNAILDGKPFRAVHTLHPKLGDEETFRRARAFLLALGHLDSAAERQNLPGIFTPDFVGYLETSEPAVLALIEEVHRRYVDTTQRSAVKEISRLPSPGPKPKVVKQPVQVPKKELSKVQASPSSGLSEWIKRIRDKLVSTTGYPPEMLEDNLDLEADLGVDSVQRAEIWVALITEHNLDQEARPKGIRTIANLAEALCELDGAAAPAGAETKAVSTTASAKISDDAPTGAKKGAMDASAWVVLVREKLVATTGYPPEMLEEQLDLEADLGVDSVQRAEIWVAIIEEYKLDKEARPKGIRTIAQLAEALAELSGVADQGEPSPVQPLPEPVAATSVPQGATDASVWVERVREKLVATTGYPPEMLEEQLDLEADLGVDSVQRAEIWVLLTEEHGLDKEARPKGIRTIAQLAESLAELSRKGSIDPGGSEADQVPADISQDEATEELEDKCELFVSCCEPLMDSAFELFKCGNVVVIAEDESKVGSSLSKCLNARDIEVSSFDTKAIVNMDEKKLASLLESQDTLIYVAHEGIVDAGISVSTLRKVLKSEVSKLFGTFRALAPILEQHPLRVIVPLSLDGAFGVSTDSNSSLLGPFPAGFIRSLAKELPKCRFQLIDTGETAWADAIDQHIDVIGSVMELGVSPYGRVTPILGRLAPSFEHKLPLEKNDLVLVTGGARGIVFECVFALALKTGCQLLLTGRTPLPEGSPDWLNTPDDEIDAVIRSREIELVREQGVNLGQAKRVGVQERAMWEVSRNLKKLESNGIEARYDVCDVSNPEALSGLLKELSKNDIVRGIVHGAGVQRSKLLTELEDNAIERTIDTKISPLLTFLETLDWTEVRMLAGFGSVTGLFGNPGQTDYALANSLLGWMVKCIGRVYPHVHAQTIDWTAWTGTGMVTDEEAKRFKEVGLRPIEVAEGVDLFIEGLLGFSHQQLAAFTPSRKMTAARSIAEHPVAARPRMSLLEEGVNRVRFSVERDVFLNQHLVRLAPVVPGTFICEIMGEAISGNGSDLCDVDFRRPLMIRDDIFDVEVLKDADKIMVLPHNRPDLSQKAMANLSFATARIGKAKASDSDKLNFEKADLSPLLVSDSNVGPAVFYNYLDKAFSDALKTGPVFRGVRSIIERNGYSLGSVTLTEEALSAFAVPGKFVFNPVLADMAVQIVSALLMQKNNVMAIPSSIGRIHVAGETLHRDAIVICRIVDISPEQITVDMAVRELDGRLIFTMDRLVSKTIATLDGLNE